MVKSAHKVNPPPPTHVTSTYFRQNIYVTFYHANCPAALFAISSNARNKENFLSLSWRAIFFRVDKSCVHFFPQESREII